jgi:hypothetical protein
MDWFGTLRATAPRSQKVDGYHWQVFKTGPNLTEGLVDGAQGRGFSSLPGINQAATGVHIFLSRTKKQKRRPLTVSGKTSEQVIIANQEKILANQEHILANQLKLEEVLKNQAAIIGNQEKLDKILTNQETILKNQEKIMAK